VSRAERQLQHFKSRLKAGKSSTPTTTMRCEAMMTIMAMMMALIITASMLAGSQRHSSFASQNWVPGDVGITQSKISARQLELGDVCVGVVCECANYG